MKQSDIVKLLRKEFGLHEVTVFTASAKNKAGILDTEIAYRGQSWWVEIKIIPDTLSPMQRKFIERHSWRAFVLTYDPGIGLYYLNHKHGVDGLNGLDFHFIKQRFDKLI